MKAKGRAFIEDGIWFGQTYLPGTFSAPPAPMHRHLLSMLDDWSRTMVACAAPAGGAKSTVTRAWLLREAIYGSRLYHAAVVGAIDKTARDQLATLRGLLEDSKELRAHAGGSVIASATADELEVVKASSWRRPEPQRETSLIRVAYPGTEIRSLAHVSVGRTYRLQVALIDDAERHMDVGSDAILRSFRSYLYDALIPRLDWGGGAGATRLIWVGNIQPYSLFARLFEGAPYTDPETGESYGESDPSKAALTKAWTLLRYDCYLRDGRTPFWETFSEDTFSRLRVALAVQPGAWERGYRVLSRPGEDEGLPWELFSDLRCYQKPAPLDRRAAELMWPRLKVGIAFDDAETTGRASDFSAPAVVGLEPAGRLHVLELAELKLAIGRQGEYLVSLIERWKPEYLVMEDPRLLEQVMSLARRKGWYGEATKVTHGSTPKRVRMLETLRPLLSQGHLDFPLDHPEWRQQVRNGCEPGAEHDDAADALQMAAARLTTGVGAHAVATVAGDFVGIGDRQDGWDRAAVEEWAKRDSIWTGRG